MTENEKHDVGATWEGCLSTVPTRSKKEYKTFKELWMKLCQAAAAGDAEKTRKLLSDGACAGHGHSLPLRLASRKGHRECVEQLIPSSSGWGVGQSSAGRISALEEAAGQGRRGCVELLISAPGMEPDVWMGLTHAAFWCQLDCVDLLLPLIGVERSESLVSLALEIERIGAETGDVVVKMLRARRESLALEQAAGKTLPANRAAIRI